MGVVLTAVCTNMYVHIDRRFANDNGCPAR
jgi:hypothetical protein